MTELEARPAPPAAGEPPSPELRRWTAYQFAAGVIKSWHVDGTRGVVVIPVDTGRGLFMIELGAADFDGILTAPIGRWFAE